MEGNPHFSTVVPPTMSHARKPRFIGSTSRESINVNSQPDNSRGFSHRMIHASLDLNQPASDLTWIWTDNLSKIPCPREVSAVHKTGLGQLLQDTNKRGFTELGENEKSVGLDLTLRLSPPQVDDEADQVAPQLGSSSGMRLDPKSKKVRVDGVLWGPS
ncbi:hypothetical protein BT93_L0533 [Corymbia citriodora subsp. variegata]|uniref:Uncharacterized protein n=1 Tax=Corymbia citriodora subsp. variegata TaxID=360336 RepID=A0A8T0CZP4_CORYI|nr:hypothetical protein BT93_L0533 [Corymbia citriodora subsp. variegata]